MTAAVAREPAAVRSGRYSAVAMVLHWLIAAGIILQVTLSFRMTGPHTPEQFAVTQLHKSIGITILGLSLLRVAWRLINPPPPMPATMAPWEKHLARVVHAGFYVIMIGMPLTGWIMVSASRIVVPTLLYGVVPWPNFPGLSELAPGAKRMWQDLGQTSHVTLSKFIYVLLALHVAGALKHQLFSRDEPVLARMAPGAVDGRWFEPRLIAIVAAFLGVIAFGWLVTPPPPGMAPAPAAAQPAPAAASPSPEAPGRSAAHDAAPAAGPAAPRASPAPAGPVRWIVQPGSSLGFQTSWSGQPLTGRFDKWKADILFSPEALGRSHVTVTIDVASVNTGDQQRDASLPSDDWFDAAAHPQAVFTANRIVKAGGERYVAHGKLTLRGVSRPVDLPFRLHITGDRAEASGVTSLDRTAFGVGQGEWRQTDQIPAKVSVSVHLTAKRG
ncbi:MAG TPA: YceI family protein [Phenylobacterium sp.]|uniref:YceI family protein n=1 Tax=Phenylobacterium sp. TaxID=1871053 RepID=UPI002BD8F127|nr:YceI family protein [Phenylobacterium sp.]HSV04615.1 YceI family protein [Phenylobacterium sp.]